MNYEDVRHRIADHINAAWVIAYPSNDVVFDNQPGPNMETEREMFSTIQIRFINAYQTAMLGTDSPARIEGMVEFSVFVPENTGSKEPIEVFDFFNELLKLTTVSGIVFKIPRSLSSLTAVGWYRVSGVAPFYTESFTL